MFGCKQESMVMVHRDCYSIVLLPPIDHPTESVNGQRKKRVKRQIIQGVEGGRKNIFELG